MLAWRLSRKLGYVEDFDFDSWDQDDRAALDQFFHTTTGAKFRQLHKSQEQKVAIWATRQSDPGRSCGHAMGLSAMIALHEQLLPGAKPVQTEQEEDAELSNYLDALRA